MEPARLPSLALVQECILIRREAYDQKSTDALMQKNAARCVSIMESSTNVIVRNCGAMALGALCEKRRLSEFIGDCGGIEALLDSLRRFRNDERMVKNTLVVLRSMFFADCNLEKFRANNGLTSMLGAMRTHPGHVGIQRACCTLLAVLSRDSRSWKLQIVASGAVPLIIGILTRFPITRKSTTQEYACMAIAYLTNDAVLCENVVASDPAMVGVSKVILESQGPDGVYTALCVFRNIMAHHDLASYPAETERAITGTAQAFLNQSSREAVEYRLCHDVGFSLLRSALLRKDSGIHEDHFLEQCLAYTQKYLRNDVTREEGVISHACACIRMLLFDDQHRENFQAIPNGIETLVHAISALKGRPIRVEHPLLALGNAVFNSAEAQRRADDMDAIRIVAQTMKTNYFSAPVTIAGLQTIHAICVGNYRTVEKATSLALQDLCVRSLLMFRDNPNVQEPGLVAVVALGQTVNGVQALRNASAMRVARRACRQFPHSERILLLTTRIKGLLDGEVSVVNDNGNVVGATTRPSMASRLLRKLSSKSSIQE